MRSMQPGAQGPALRQRDGRLLLTFHYYDTTDNGTSKLGEAVVEFSSGWPTIVTTVP